MKRLLSLISLLAAGLVNAVEYRTSAGQEIKGEFLRVIPAQVEFETSHGKVTFPLENFDWETQERMLGRMPAGRQVELLDELVKESIEVIGNLESRVEELEEKQPKPPAEGESRLQLSNIRASVVDSNDTITTVAWAVDVENRFGRSVRVDVEFAGVDDSGLQLSSDTLFNELLREGKNEVRGRWIMRSHVYDRIKTWEVETKAR